MRLFTLLFSLLPAVLALAAPRRDMSDLPVMNIDFSSGNSVSISVSDGLELSVDDSFLLIDSNSSPCSYELADIRRISYSHNLSGGTDVPVSGDAFGLVFDSNSIVINTGSGRSRCEVMTPAGLSVRSLDFDRSVRVDVASLPAGVYIVVVDGFNPVKIIKR